MRMGGNEEGKEPMEKGQNETECRRDRMRQCRRDRMRQNAEQTEGTKQKTEDRTDRRDRTDRMRQNKTK